MNKLKPNVGNLEVQAFATASPGGER